MSCVCSGKKGAGKKSGYDRYDERGVKILSATAGAEFVPVHYLQCQNRRTYGSPMQRWLSWMVAVEEPYKYRWKSLAPYWKGKALFCIVIYATSRYLASGPYLISPSSNAWVAQGQKPPHQIVGFFVS